MPGRKSNVSTVSNGPEEVPEPASTTKASKERDGLSVDDLSLPKSMIARLSKGVLPANTQIHKDALLALHKSATVFVSYIASGANENAFASGKKTIAPQDVISSLKDAELEGFLPRLEAELKKYNEMQCDKRNTYRKKVKEEKAAAAVKDGSGEGVDSGASKDDQAAEGLNGVSEAHPDDGEEERPIKKMKGANGNALAPDPDDDDDEENDADEQQDPDDNDDDAFEDAPEDEIDDEDEDDGGDGQDETMEDALEEPEGRSEIVDEALDEPDSD